MIIELSYMTLIVKNFVTLKYLISIHLFASKLTQSIFLFLFHVISVIIHSKNGPASDVPPSIGL
jgi:hypothetical protein